METSTDPFEILAEFEPTPFPVLSAYLDLRPGDSGHYAILPYLKTTLRRKAQRFEEGSEERRSYDRDAEALLALFEDEGRFAKPSGGTVAVFLCGEAGLEEIVEYDAPLDAHFLHVGHRPICSTSPGAMNATRAMR
jgi:hypothetical protein